MIRCRTKLAPEDSAPEVVERKELLAAEAVLDTGEGFKIVAYLDSNGDWSVRVYGTVHPAPEVLTGNWKPETLR